MSWGHGLTFLGWLGSIVGLSLGWGIELYLVRRGCGNAALLGWIGC